MSTKSINEAEVKSTAAENAVAMKEEKKAAAKTKTKKTETAKADEKKAVAKKTTAKKAAPKKSTAAKTTETVQEVFFEYGDEQILSEELVTKIKEAYKAEGHRISSIKLLRAYIKPEERKVYYVINDKAEGKFIEF